VRSSCQGYDKVLNGICGGKGDLRYGAVGNPFPLQTNEEGNCYLVVKRDLQRLREKALTENQPA
jgi:hypothetical protein